MGAYTAHGPEAESALAPSSHEHNDHSDPEKVVKDSDSQAHSHMDVQQRLSDENALAQMIGVAILEFGVILHRHVHYFRGSHIILHIANWVWLSAF